MTFALFLVFFFFFCCCCWWTPTLFPIVWLLAISPRNSIRVDWPPPLSKMEGERSKQQVKKKNNNISHLSDNRQSVTMASRRVDDSSPSDVINIKINFLPLLLIWNLSVFLKLFFPVDYHLSFSLSTDTVEKMLMRASPDSDESHKILFHFFPSLGFGDEGIPFRWLEGGMSNGDARLRSDELPSDARPCPDDEDPAKASYACVLLVLYCWLRVHKGSQTSDGSCLRGDLPAGRPPSSLVSRAGRSSRSRRYEVRRYSAVSLMTPFFIFKECARP